MKTGPGATADAATMLPETAGVAPPPRPRAATWAEPTVEASFQSAAALPTSGLPSLPPLSLNAQPARAGTPAPEMALRDVAVESGELPAGTQVGEYEVTKKLGEGGMGMVFAGIQPVIGKRVAIKVLAPEFAKNAEIVRRFITEARAVNQIGHRNIIDIFSFWQLPDGRHYFVMEYLDGESLADRLARIKVMRFDEGIPVLLQICDALAAAHAKGIVHRDMKPDNVYLAAGTLPFAKILDFGIAKLSGPEGAMTKTRTGVPMGTPLYMSPEQCRGIAVDHRTDIYALGIMMYEMFAGRTPFQADTYLDVITGHLSQPPTPPSALADVPPLLERIILKAVEKRPEDRFQTAAELGQELAAIQAGLPAVSPTLHPGAAEAIAAMTGSAATAMPAVSAATASLPSLAGAGPKRGFPVIPVVVAALVLAVGIGVAAYLLRGRGGSAAGPGPVAATPAAGAGAAAPAVTPGRLVVASPEPGAEVEIDGAKRGVAPVTVDITRGEPHVVVVTKAGFKPFTTRFTLGPSEPERKVTAALAKLEVPRGTLKVVTGRANAVVTVDGKEAGRGAVVSVVDLVADAAHVVRVEADGREGQERSVTIAAGKEKVETFALKRAHRSHHAAAKSETQKLAPTPKPETKTKTKPVKKPAGTDETLKPW